MNLVERGSARMDVATRKLAGVGTRYLRGSTMKQFPIGSEDWCQSTVQLNGVNEYGRVVLAIDGWMD